MEAAGRLHGGGPSCGARGGESAGGPRALGSRSCPECPRQGTWRAWRPWPAEGCPPLDPTHAGGAELPASAGPPSHHHWVWPELSPHLWRWGTRRGPREAPPGCCELPLCSGPLGRTGRHPQGAVSPATCSDHLRHWCLGVRTPRRPLAASGANPAAPRASDRPSGTQRGDCLLRSHGCTREASSAMQPRGQTQFSAAESDPFPASGSLPKWQLYPPRMRLGQCNINARSYLSRG